MPNVPVVAEYLKAKKNYKNMHPTCATTYHKHPKDVPPAQQMKPSLSLQQKTILLIEEKNYNNALNSNDSSSVSGNSSTMLQHNKAKIAVKNDENTRAYPRGQ